MRGTNSNINLGVNHVFTVSVDIGNTKITSNCETSAPTTKPPVLPTIPPKPGTILGAPGTLGSATTLALGELATTEPTNLDTTA